MHCQYPLIEINVLSLSDYLLAAICFLFTERVSDFKLYRVSLIFSACIFRNSSISCVNIYILDIENCFCLLLLWKWLVIRADIFKRRHGLCDVDGFIIIILLWMMISAFPSEMFFSFFFSFISPHFVIETTLL